MALKQVQADEPRAPLHGDLGLRGDHEVGAGEVAPRAAARRRAAGTTAAGSPRATRAAATSASFRTIDFKRTKDGIPAKVAAIEYDPNRSARIALLHYADGAKSYILAPVAGCGVGAMVESGPDADIKPGNALPLANIPTGTLVHDVELKPGQGGRMARSAGSSVQLVAKDGDHGVLRLPSGELRRVLLTCRATVGPGREHGPRRTSPSGKAGRSRWLGKRPTVRGSAMNPVDHPHGGGEGKTKGGRHPVTPWGVPTLGKRTRRKHKESDKLIVRGRRRGKERKR